MMIEVMSLIKEAGCLVVQKMLLAVSNQKFLHLALTSNPEKGLLSILACHLDGNSALSKFGLLHFSTASALSSVCRHLSPILVAGKQKLKETDNYEEPKFQD